MEALQYLILHIAKTKATNSENDFEVVFAQSGLRPEFVPSLLNVLRGHADERRQILEQENLHGEVRLRELDCRLAIVSARR